MKHKLKHKKFVSELTKVSNERFPGFHWNFHFKGENTKVLYAIN
jgi:hypothetical protein